MNELLLSTTDRKTKTVYTKKDYLGNPIQTRTVWNEYPIGQVINVRTEIDTRREWLAIMCDMVAPAFAYTLPSGAVIQRPDKRTEFYKRWLALGWNEAQWKAITDCWTYDRFDKWFKGSIKEPITRVMDEIATWTDIEKSLQKDDLGKEFYGINYLCDVYPWGPNSRKLFLIVVNDDLSQAISKEYEGVDEENIEVSTGVFEVVMKPKRIIDWVNDIGLSGDTLTKINDPTIEVHPKYDIKIVKEKIVTPVVVKDINDIQLIK